MAMTKKELASIDALKKELAEERAFSWPREAEPTPVNISEWLAENNEKLFIGWTFNTYAMTSSHYGHISDCVKNGCSNGIHHSNGRIDKTDTQNVGGPWYHTKREAAIALRWAVCRAYAKKLAALDDLIGTI